MKYSTQLRQRKYVERYGILPFARKFRDKYGKKVMDTATKTEIDAKKMHLSNLFKKQQKLQQI